MKIVLMTASLVLGVLAFAVPVCAKEFDAIVTNVTEGGAAITATVTDEYGVTEDNFMFNVLPAAELINLDSVGSIKPGSRLHIKADKDSAGRWQISRLGTLE